MLRFAFVLAALCAGRLFAAPGPAVPATRQPAPVYRLAPPAMRAQGPYDGAPSLPRVSASVAPLLLALPAHAGYGNSGYAADDGGGIVGTIVNAGLTVIVLGFAAFILKYAFEAASEVASQSGERMDRLGFNDKNENAPRSNEPIYDDTDYQYKDLSKRVENSRTREKQSKQFKADGTRLAPWMVIDEDKVAQMKQKREDRIKKEQEPPKKKAFWEK